MDLENRLLSVLNIGDGELSKAKAIAKEAGLSYKRIKYYNDFNILPSGKDLKLLLDYLKISELELMLKLGILNQEVIDKISANSREISKIIGSYETSPERAKKYYSIYQTEKGVLYNHDCIDLMKTLEDESIDLIFADPPFNLNKIYPSGMNDNITELEYISWTESWLSECVRILKPGGSFFVWNIPKWNTYFSSFLNRRLTFRHWIATDIKFSLPISGRLYPSHYSLLYYCKGEKPRTFQPDRMQMEVCPKCYHDLKDYGGYKSKMNPTGINLTDVWYDIPPVRHKKHKGRVDANELSVKLLDRVIEMSSQEQDLVFDPFGGAGTTYVVAEIKKRRWIGTEIGPVESIIERFKKLDKERKLIEKYRDNYNALFPDRIKKERKNRNLWTEESFNGNKLVKKNGQHSLQGKLF